MRKTSHPALLNGGLAAAFLLAAAMSSLLTPSFALDLNLGDVKILFSKREGDNYDIYLLERPGGKPIRLTNHPAYDGTPRWSPDGKKAIFISQRDGENRLYLIDLEDRAIEPLKIPDKWAWIGRPEWSPDGKKILFSARDQLWGFNKEYGLYLFDVYSGKVSRLIKECGFGAWLSPRRIIGFYRGKFHILDVRLGELQQFSLPQGVFPTLRISPSPDGRRIVFDGGNPNPMSGGRHEIYLMDLTTGEVVNLTNSLRVGEGAPCWTPDGRFILFPREVDREWDIFIMTPDGKIVGRLGLEGRNFSPDVFDPNHVYSIPPPIDLKAVLWGAVKRGTPGGEREWKY
ncbi:hypothetical protein DRP77_08435 [Candidatus Poribacteria bacterium]|nr:MAG: hypothetical protein DRP77_08435 [Candidatus Poribacteria bacterium]